MVEPTDTQPRTHRRASLTNAPLPCGGRVGDYVLLESMGEGSWCRAFRALHRARKQVCALKLLVEEPANEEVAATAQPAPLFIHRGESAARRPLLTIDPPSPLRGRRKSVPRTPPKGWALLQREALANRRTSHPNLLALEEVHLEEPPYYLVFEWFEGTSLREQLDRQEKLPISAALWVARQIAQALGALHQVGLMHGDVKPENVLVDGLWRVKLIDLGLARDARNASTTARGAEEAAQWSGPETRKPQDVHEAALPASPSGPYLGGTARYLAPELAAPALRGDIRADIYSLGVTLYEMLTGRLPFPEQDLFATLQCHRQSVPQSARDVDPFVCQNLVKLLQQMLAKDPLRRPQSSADLVALLLRKEIDWLDYLAG